MVLGTLLLDILGGLLFIWLRTPSGPALVGTAVVLESLASIGSLTFAVAYRGRRRSSHFNYRSWTHHLTVGYAFIIFSLLAHVLLTFLYCLAASNMNPLIFAS